MLAVESPASVQLIIIYYKKLDHIPSSYIVLMVHVVKGRQYTHRCRGLNRRDEDRLSTSCFDASIKGDELDSTVQLPNFRSVVA